MDYTVHGILQARILEWVAIPFSRDLPDPGIEPGSPALQANSVPSELPREPQNRPQIRNLSHVKKNKLSWWIIVCIVFFKSFFNIFIISVGKLFRMLIFFMFFSPSLYSIYKRLVDP